MFTITRVLVGIALGLLWTAAHADRTVNFSWAHPTTWDDGSALPVTDIELTRIEWGTCNAAATGWGTKEGEWPVTAPANTASVLIPGTGVKCFRLFTKVKATVGGATSASSSIVSRNISKRPNAATNFTITIPQVPQ